MLRLKGPDTQLEDNQGDVGPNSIIREIFDNPR